jgi:hypothetical protein
MLFIVRGSMALSGWNGPRAEAVGLGALLASSGLTGVAMVRIARELGPSSEALVASPVLLVVSLVAGAGLLWALARAVSQAVPVHGTLLLAAAGALDGAAGSAREVAREIVALFGHAALDPVRLAPPAGAACGMAIALGTLALRGAGAWPKRILGGLQVRSAVDLLLVPIAAHVALTAQMLFPIPQGRELAVVEGALGAALPLVLAGVLMGRHPGTAGRRAFIAPAVVCAALGIGLLGAMARAQPTWTYAGRGRFEVTLVSKDGRFEDDGEVLVDRLRRLGAKADIMEARRGHIRLRVTDISAPAEALHDLGEPLAFSARWIDESVPLFENGDVLAARVVTPPDAPPMLDIVLREEAAEAFGAATAAHIGREIAFMLDRRMLSHPRVVGRLGNHIQLPLDPLRRDSAAFARTYAVAAALGLPPLTGTWRVAASSSR